MADKIVPVPGVGPIAFPDSMSDDDISQAVSRLSVKDKPNDSGALTLEAIRGGFGPATRLAEQVATSPAVPRGAALIGKVIGGAAPVIGGASYAGIPGALIGVGGVAKGAWAGSKAGWFTGKLAQNMAAPVAAAMDAAKPVAKTVLHELAGVQGLLDLAQMAEPNRTDIGFLGIGGNPKADPDIKAKIAANNAKGIQDAKDHPAPSLNSIADAFEQSIKNAPEVWAHVLQSVKNRMSGK